jgi:hypothetical protein
VLDAQTAGATSSITPITPSTAGHRDQHQRHHDSRHQTPFTCVPEPKKARADRPPTAICQDGDCSYSEHPYSGGTCHGQGGVAWVLGTNIGNRPSLARARLYYSPMPLGHGQVFAGFRIVRLLGSGGMGEVYLAEHPRLPRHDALNVLPADVSADPEFGAGSTAKLTSRPRSFIRTSSAYTTEVSSTVNCGSRWTTSRAPMRGS